MPIGDDRDRTGNLLVANQALSQLSYVPEGCFLSVFTARFSPPENPSENYGFLLFLGVPVAGSRTSRTNVFVPAMAPSTAL